MSLSLPEVTLLAIDTVDPRRTIKAMQYSMLQVQFAKAVLVTAPVRFQSDMLKTIGGKGRIDQIEVHFTNIGPRSDYERQIIEDLPKWFSTDFCLFHEWDAAVMNADAWNPDWLGCDFIGAPWPYGFHENGYPICTKDNCVGNGGFSLRSQRFCHGTAEVFRRNRPKAMPLSDAWISRTARPQLETMGMVFAPEEEAARFSCENRFYNGQFGIHGKNTIEMNGLKWGFDWIR